MPSSSHSLLNYLRVIVGAWREDARTDAELLARFAEARDETAFTTLVWRHGALVWGTCRRILGDTPDAEDAFQATFLSLARTVGHRAVESLASWLHQVARRAALDVQSSAQRRRGLEQRLRAVSRPGVEEDADRAELYAALDEELAGLPEKLRVPLVLRYLDGKTQNEVASILGCSRSVALKRLAKGEALLRERLERRGLGVGIGSMAVLLGGATAGSAMPAPLAHSTVKAVLAFAAAPAADGFLSAWAASSAQGSLRTLSWGKTLPLVLGVAAVSVILAGAGVWAYQHNRADASPSAAMPPAKASPVAAPREKPRRPDPPRLDLFGAPLPDHAVARMGMVRFRHFGPVSAVACAPDGKTIASASWDKTVRLWDTATGKELRKRVGHDQVVSAVAFAPDGKTLASASGDNVHLWDAATGKELRCLKGHQQAITAVAFSPGGKELASASWDQSVRIWDVAAGRELRRLQGHTDRVFAVAFSADGETVASGGGEGDQTVRLWNVRSGEEAGKLEGHKGAIAAVAFSPDGKTLASGGVDGTIRLWRMATGREVHKLQAQPVPGHQRGVSALTFAPDGQTLVSGNIDWTIRFWDVNDGTELHTAKAHSGQYSHLGFVFSLAFSRDGKFLVSGGADHAVRLWEPSTGKQIQNWQGHKEYVASVVFTPDGQTLASGSLDNTVCLWDTATGKQLCQLDGPQGSLIHEVALSPNGKTLATANYDKTVRLWDKATGKEVQKLEGHTESVSTVAFSPDGKTLASGGTDMTLRLWDLTTGQERHILRQTALVMRAAFSPDGRTIALVGYGDKAISLWDVDTGRRIVKLEGHRSQVGSVAFSPDGKALASAGWDGTVRLWDIAAAKEVLKLEGHEGPVNCVAFAPQGRYAASGGKDGTVRLWELASARECGRFTGHEGPICSVVFSPDGGRLASGAGDHTVLVWDLTGRMGEPAPAPRLGLEDLERLWSDLARMDAIQAYRSGRLLASVPDRAVSLLRQRLCGPLKSETPLRFVLGQDAADYPRSEEGEPMKTSASSAEGNVRRGKTQELVFGENLRIVRAVAVLEWIGTDEAKELLHEVGEQAQQAQAALDKELGRRP